MNRTLQRAWLRVAATILPTVLIVAPAWADLNDGLVAYWSFDEGSGAIAHDYSGNGNDGVLHGPLWIPGVCGTALSFDGVDDYVGVADHESQQLPGNEVTVSAWMRLDADVGATQKRIVNKQEIGARAWGLEIFGEGYHGSGGNRVVFHDSNGFDSYYMCISPTRLDVGRWYHVLATDDEGSIRIYVNGELDHACAGGYGLPSPIFAEIAIGRLSQEAWFYFPGIIDEVRIYHRILSPVEVYELYRWDQRPDPQSSYTAGNQDGVSGTSNDPVNTSTGNLFRQETDLSAPTRGGLMAFTRYYNSAAAKSGRRNEGTQGRQSTRRASGPLREGAGQPGQRSSDDIAVRAAALAVVAATVPGLGLVCWFLQRKSQRRTRRSEFPRNRQRPRVRKERRSLV